MRDHIRALGLTPEGEAEEWAAIAVAHASVTSRKEAARIENARSRADVVLRKRAKKRPR